jgi:hypothetical protein
MPNQRRLRHRVPGLILVIGILALLLGALAPADALAAKPRNPPHLAQFMWALASVESGGNYYSWNRGSGAYGRYQIMPSSWRGWAAQYAGDKWADPNPYHQEVVAQAKVKALYRWLGSWRNVAHWWLTGSSDSRVSHWSATARRYVNSVMRSMARAPAKPRPMPANPAGDNGITIHAGDYRLVAAWTRAWDRVGSGRHALRGLARGRLVKVLAARYGGRHHAVWLKIALPNGAVGWIVARATLPARAPKH